MPSTNDARDRAAYVWKRITRNQTACYSFNEPAE